MFVPTNAKTNDIKAVCIGDAFGINIIATTIPSCAESIVAPVVGDTNLFLHSCCIIKPATLIPVPVQRIANNRGKRDIKNNSGVISITPTNNDPRLRMINKLPRITVLIYCITPFQLWLVNTNPLTK